VGKIETIYVCNHSHTDIAKVLDFPNIKTSRRFCNKLWRRKKQRIKS